MITFRTCCTLLIGAAAAGWCSPGEAQTQAKPKPKAQSEAPLSRAAPKSSKSDAEPAAGNEVPKRTRPVVQELKIAPLPKELEELLKEWELQSAKIRTLVGEHQRIVYNGVFEVEKYANGKFYYESPDKGRIDLEGVEVEKGTPAKRQNTKGEDYKIEADQKTKWVCTGDKILNINDDEKTYESFDLPKELQGTNIIHGPLPFLFGMKAEEAKRRFEIAFVNQKNPKQNNADVVWLTAKPRMVADRENFQLATIILDRKRFLPHAVKLLDPSGNLETVYTFPAKSLHVNQRNMIPPIFRNDPFHPRLAGYKPMQQQVVVPDGQKKSDAGKGSGKIQQTANSTDGTSNAGSSKVKSAAASKTGTSNRSNK